MFFLEDYLQINSDKKLTQNDVKKIKEKIEKRFKLLK